MLDTLSPPYSVPPSLPPSTRRHKLDDLSLQPEDPSLQLLTGFNSSLSLDDGGDYKPAIYHGGQSESVLAGYRSPLKAESGLGAYGSPTIEHSSQYAPSKLRHTTTFNPLTAVWHLSHFLIFCVSAGRCFACIYICCPIFSTGYTRLWMPRHHQRKLLNLSFLTCIQVFRCSYSVEHPRHAAVIPLSSRTVIVFRRRPQLQFNATG